MHEVGRNDTAIRMASEDKLLPPVSLQDLEYLVTHLVFLQSLMSDTKRYGHNLNSNDPNLAVPIAPRQILYFPEKFNVRVKSYAYSMDEK